MNQAAKISVPSAADQRKYYRMTNIRRSQDLVLEIDSRTQESLVEDGMNMSMTPTRVSTPRRVNFSPAPGPFREEAQSSPRPSLSKEKTSFRNLVPKLSFKFRKASSDIEKGASTSLGSSSSGIREMSSMARTFSKTTVQGSIPRSRSVPMFDKDGKLIDPVGSIFRVIPLLHERKCPCKLCGLWFYGSDEDDGEDIPEEEAVCRICFVELAEGSDILKMECSCKGELALAHQDCTVKWFSIKAHPVQGNVARQMHFRYRVWQDIPVLVTVSMLGYFCFLDQLPGNYQRITKGIN
ncbi:hypothetical protein AKJ16_DCAP08528 [Drosera capensis]